MMRFERAFNNSSIVMNNSIAANSAANKKYDLPLSYRCLDR